MPNRNASTHRRRTVARITRIAGQWARFARSSGCTFDVEGKAASSVAFCIAAGGSSFAIPSKLTGTSKHQRELASLAPASGWPRLDIDLDEQECLTAYWHRRPIGRTQSKHDGWLQPLLATGHVSCYVLDVTGTDDESKTLGCNIVFTGIKPALSSASRAHAHRILGTPAIAA